MVSLAALLIPSFCDQVMPNKYAEKKGWNVPKQKYRLSNWSEYSDALRRRGEIDVWLSGGPDANPRNFRTVFSHTTDLITHLTHAHR